MNTCKIVIEKRALTVVSDMQLCDFQIGMRALPYKENFIKSFSEDSSPDVTEEEFHSCVLRDAKQFQEAVIAVCTPIIDFYRERNMIIEHVPDQSESSLEL